MSHRRSICDDGEPCRVHERHALRDAYLATELVTWYHEKVDALSYLVHREKARTRGVGPVENESDEPFVL